MKENSVSSKGENSSTKNINNYEIVCPAILLNDKVGEWESCYDDTKSNVI